MVCDLITADCNKSTRSSEGCHSSTFMCFLFAFAHHVVLRNGAVRTIESINMSHTHAHNITHTSVLCGVGFTATTTTLTSYFMHFSFIFFLFFYFSRRPLVIDSDKRTCDYVPLDNNVSCKWKPTWTFSFRRQRVSEICALLASRSS